MPHAADQAVMPTNGMALVRLNADMAAAGDIAEHATAGAVAKTRTELELGVDRVRSARMIWELSKCCSFIELREPAGVKPSRLSFFLRVALHSIHEVRMLALSRHALGQC